MSPDRITLSPEVEELLREVARRPGSGLLRVERKDVVRTVLERESLVRATSAGLTAAELQLVEVHREEVAHALALAAHRAVCVDGRSHGFVANSADPRPRFALPTESSVRHAANAALRSPLHGSEATEAHDLLERVVRADRSAVPGSLELASAACRLLPRASSRVHVAIALTLDGDVTGARISWAHLLEGALEDSVREAALLGLTDVLLRVGSLDQARVAARDAERRLPDSLPVRVNALLCGLAARDDEWVRSVLVRVDADAPPDPADRLRWIEFLRGQGSSEVRAARARARARVLRLVPERGQWAREWIDALMDD